MLLCGARRRKGRRKCTQGNCGGFGRHHLRIEYDEMEDVCYAIDNGSVNGTFLNSERMAPGERYRLIQGDRLRIDDREFEVDYANY